MKQKLKKGDACTLNFRTPPLDFPHCNIGSNHYTAGYRKSSGLREASLLLIDSVLRSSEGKQWTSESSAANATWLSEVSLVPAEKDTGCKVHASFTSLAFFQKKNHHYSPPFFFVTLRWHLVQSAYIRDLII